MSTPPLTGAGAARIGTTGSGVDAEMALAFLKHMLDPEVGVIEVRIFEADLDRQGHIVPATRFTKTFTGWFDNIPDLVASLDRLRGVSAYVTVNPVNRDLMGWVSNRLKASKDATADKHIVCWRWFFIDIDPERLTGTSATNAELALAVELRDKLLAENPDLAACANHGRSGNGCWVLVRLPDYPNDKTTSTLVAEALDILKARYDTEAVKIDETAKNPSRVMCLPGTLKTKGENLPDRPHRLATIESEPGAPVPFDLVAWVAANRVAVEPEPAPPPEIKTVRGPAPGKPTGSSRTRPDDETRAVAYLAKCEPAISGQKGHTSAIKAALAVGPGFDLLPAVAFRLLWDHYNPRCEPRWSEKELQHKVEDAFTIETRRGWIRDAERPYQGGSNGQHRSNGQHHGAVGPNLTAKATTGRVEAPEPVDPDLVLETRRLSSIKPVPIEWLVPDRLPLGKLVVLAGEGGLGKSSLSLELAARLTRGEPMFGGSELGDVEGPADVLLMAIEDDLADTQVVRLHAAGADLDRVHTVDGIRVKNGKLLPFSLAHVEILERTLQTIHQEVRFVIVDPAAAFVGRAQVDDHRNAELTSLLAPLQELAARKRVTIVLILHLNKGTSSKAVHRVMGGVAYVNSARVAYLAATDPEDPTRKVLACIKYNLGPQPRPIGYRLQLLDETERAAVLGLPAFAHLVEKQRTRMGRQLGRIEWLGDTETTIESCLSAPTGEKKRGAPSKRPEAKKWLHGYLAKGSCPGELVKAEAAKAGFGKNMIWEVFEELKAEYGVKPRKTTGDDGKVLWLWPSLPAPEEISGHLGDKDSWDSWDTSKVNSPKNPKNSNNPKNPKNPSQETHTHTEEREREREEDEESEVIV